METGCKKQKTANYSSLGHRRSLQGPDRHQYQQAVRFDLVERPVQFEPPEDSIDFSKPGNSIRRPMASEENLIGISEEIQSPSLSPKNRKSCVHLVDFSDDSNGHNGSTQDGGKSGPAEPIGLRHRAESNGYIIDPLHLSRRLSPDYIVI